MKVISLHVDSTSYAGLRALAARRGRPVAELVREAMDSYLRRETNRGASVLSLEPHDSGKLLAGWTRSELLDEMGSA